jgi:hypothetical protein
MRVAHRRAATLSCRRKSSTIVAFAFHQARICVIAFIAAAQMSACGGGAGQETAPPSADALSSMRPVDYSDVEIAQILYADSSRTPPGFFQDAAATMPGYVATSHLKSSDLVAGNGTPLYELCADDWAIALQWSDQTSASSTLIDTMMTTAYYEFDRARSGTPTGYLRERVYRCSYLDRSTVDLRGTGTNAGRLNVRPITADELRRLAEYLWQFTPYNNYGNAVLKSSGATTPIGFTHTLTIATLTPAAGCDHIAVLGWTHSVDLQSGALNLDLQPLWDFGSRRANGIVELCNPIP